MAASQLESNTLWLAVRDSLESWQLAIQNDAPGRAGAPPLMIETMNRGLDRYPHVDAAIKSANFNDPLQMQFCRALERYTATVDAFFAARGEYPTALTLPKPANDCEKYVWMLLESFLQYKTGKKPRLQEADC